MNQLTIIQQHATVVDQVLSDTHLCELGDVIAEAGFVKVLATDRNDIWKQNGSLNPEAGSIQVIWTEDEDLNKVVKHFDSVAVYPTHTVLDEILQVAKGVAKDQSLLDGGLTEGDEYVGIVAYFYRYPPGSRLVWHFDGSYLGGFAMYLTSDWDENWGGYFAFEDVSDNQCRPGLGHYVEPRFNRMVVFGSKVRHAVLSVANDAPTSRVGLAGFFVKKSHAKSVLKL